MALFNHTTKELTAKIVYYGPGLCGKTTNLRVLHGQLERATKGRLLSLATAQDRTIYFDLLPIELGNIKGYTVRFQLCTVPGQVFYNETRKIVLRGVDGIVFVVDSQWSMLSHNLESFQNMKENLAEEKVALESIPLVVQYNKRDLPGSMSLEALQDALGFAAFPFVEAVASDGKGVIETFRLVSKLTFVDLLRRLQKGAQAKAPASGETAAAALAAATAAVPALATPVAEAAEPVFAAPEPEPPPRPAAAELHPSGSGAAVSLAEAAPGGEGPGAAPIPDVSFDDERSWAVTTGGDAFADLDEDEIPRGSSQVTAVRTEEASPPEPPALEPPAAAAPPPAPEAAPAPESHHVAHEPLRASSPGSPLPDNAGALTAIERIRREVEERRLRMQLETRAIASSEIPKARLAGLFAPAKPPDPPPEAPGATAGETQQIGTIRTDEAEVRRLEDSLTRALRSIDEESDRRRERRDADGGPDQRAGGRDRTPERRARGNARPRGGAQGSGGIADEEVGLAAPPSLGRRAVLSEAAQPLSRTPGAPAPRLRSTALRMESPCAGVSDANSAPARKRRQRPPRPSSA